MRRIALLSNITVDLIVEKLSKSFNVYCPEGYDAWTFDILNDGSELYSGSIDAYFILLDGTETRSFTNLELINERINNWKNTIKRLIQSIYGAPVFISTIDFRTSEILTMKEMPLNNALDKQWVGFLEEITEENKNAYVFDLKTMVLNAGRTSFYSNKMWYLGNMPYSITGIKTVAKEIENYVIRYYEAPKKIIVLDLDNTLWGGVAGEDGVEGIVLSDHKEGQRYYDFQYQLLQLKKMGYLLAINSKNNIEDVKTIFENHPYMLLKWDDFVSKKINWNNKAINIKEIERDLNLTEGSFVFIDDNPIERDIVKGECPDVEVLAFPEDTTELYDFSNKFYKEWFLKPKTLDEDTKKSEMYFVEAKRAEEKNTSVSLDDYIRRLEIEIDIHPMMENELDRVVQLCNKTNQFNLTTKRYTEKDILDLNQKQNNKIYTVYVKDKYGDSGLVSIIILQKNNIDTFLMSCRVMGRKIEYAVVYKVLDSIFSQDNYMVYAEYIKTSKNKPVEDLFEKLGFEIISLDSEKKKYSISKDTFKKIQAAFDMNVFKKIIF